MGIYPKIDSSSDVIENCSKCYVASLRCADPDGNDIERFAYTKDENNYYCIKTTSKFSHKGFPTNTNLKNMDFIFQFVKCLQITTSANILFVTSNHQFIFTKPPSRFRKGRLISVQQKAKRIKIISLKKS